MSKATMTKQDRKEHKKFRKSRKSGRGRQWQAN